MLGFSVNLGDVLAYDTQTEQLQPGNKQENADGGCPSCNRVAEDQAAYNHKNEAEEGDKGHKNAKPRGNAQRRLRKVDDAINGIMEKLPEAPFGLTGNALNVLGRLLAKIAGER